MPIRLAVMGEASRPASEPERREMRAILANAADEGARGLSTGLTYGHTMFADTDEIVETARALRPYGWGYHTHMRDQGEHLLTSMREAIEISERAEVPLTISHLYPTGKENWGKAGPALDLLEDARDRGLQVGYDVTPWLRGGGPLAQSLEGWVREGGHDAMLERLRDPELRIRIGRELGELWDWDDLLICHVGNKDHLDWLGRTITEIADERGIPPVEAGPLLLMEDEAQFWIAPEFKSDRDVDMLVKHPLGAVVADALALSPEGPLAFQDRPNSYGTFPRVLGRYVRERGVITWEEAVQKMTSIPASRVGLWDRGVLKPGLMADVVVFNPETVIEKADYTNPQEFPEGIDWVVVNGQVTVSPEGHTGAQAGRAL